MKSNNYNLSLGEVIAQYRKDKGYSQRRFAQISGLSNTTISRIENGETSNPDIETLKLIALHLNINEAQLLKHIKTHVNTDATPMNARLKYLQQPIRKITRYSTVMTAPADIPQTESAEELALPITPEAPPVSIPVKKVPIKGMKLITLRLENNITQKELADALGLDKTLISQYEGEIIQPEYTTVQKLADFFGITADYLMGVQKLQEEPMAYVEPIEETPKEMIEMKTMPTDLRPEYLQLAQEIQASGIDINDIRLLLNTLIKYKKLL